MQGIETKDLLKEKAVAWGVASLLAHANAKSFVQQNLALLLST